MRAEQTYRATGILSGHALAGLLFRLLLGVCLLLYVAPSVHADGSYSSGGSYYDDEEDDDDETDFGLAAALFTGGVYIGAFCAGVAAAVAPWWAPPLVLEDDYHLDGHFPHHPYEDGHGGFLILDDNKSQPHTRTGTFFIRGAVDGGSDFDGIERVGANLHLEHRQRLGVDASWSTFFVQPDSSALDDFSVGDANLIFRFAQSEHAQWWTGAGVSWVESSAAETDYGVNFTYGTDVYIGDPWVFSFQIDVGSIFHTSATLGAEWNGLEVYTGFDYMDVDDIGSAPTMVVGLRAWF